MPNKKGRMAVTKVNTQLIVKKSIVMTNKCCALVKKSLPVASSKPPPEIIVKHSSNKVKLKLAYVTESK